MFDIARMFHVEGGVEAVKKWPFSRYRKYRQYWLEYTRRDLMKRGIDPDPKPEEDDKPRYWIEEGDAQPFKGRAWSDEVAVTRG
jgi:hypothetical protein